MQLGIGALAGSAFGEQVITSPYDFFEDADVREDLDAARKIAVASPSGLIRRKTVVAPKGATPSPDDLMVVGQSFPPTIK